MRLLFFSPFCGRTGSEMGLYQLIRHADRSDIKMTVACGAKGALSKRFPPDVRVVNYYHALSLAQRAFPSRSLGLWFANFIFDNIIRLIHLRVRPDVWYVNTIVQPRLLALARSLGVPCILHTRELEHIFALLKPGDVEMMISYPKLIIASSQGAANILRVLGRRDNVEVLYTAIDGERFKIDQQESKAIRQGLGIPREAFVWAMSGTRDPNKNPVGFVRIVAELVKQGPSTHFLWIGGADTGYSLYARALATKLGIADKISWVGERADDYLDYLNVADGFVLTSLNESLSVVTLEAAALGKPFVSFNSGGPKEIFREGMGVVVDSWNVEDIVKAMLQVMRGDIYLNEGVSRRRAAEFDVSVLVKQWERIIRKYVIEKPDLKSI
jgi:glycosyltransferase involved in cell wall biosynthesis